MKIADHFKAKGIEFLKEHTVLESIGKKAVDGLLRLRSPYYASSKHKQTALDVTVTCPACPTYLTPAAAACNTRCTDQAEVGKHTKYRQIGTDASVDFSVAAFTSYGSRACGCASSQQPVFEQLAVFCTQSRLE
jgi:hypothetical protein